MFRFAHPEFLYLLAILPLLLAVYVFLSQFQKRRLGRFGNPLLVMPFIPGLSPFRKNLRFSFLIIALSGLVFALAGPQFGAKLRETKREGIEIIVALDISNSMLAEDIQPNRIERARQAISSLIDRLGQDKIGLIVFAGDAYTQVPLTTDYASAKIFLTSVSPNIITKQGTAIGAAIDLATKSFSPAAQSSKAIVIISDGEDHEGNVADMARSAAEKGIVIHTIGMGSTKGAPIPVGGSIAQRDFLKDRSGSVVISRLNPTMLGEIATAGGGRYIQATTTRVGLHELYSTLKNLDKEVYEAKVYSEYAEQFPYIIWMVFTLLIIEFLIRERKGKWLSKINILKF